MGWSITVIIICLVYAAIVAILEWRHLEKKYSQKEQNQKKEAF